MPSNKELMKRADMALADLESNGGMLNVEQANTFIDMVQEQPTILRESRLIRMNSPQMRINRLGFADRIMKAAPQGTSPYADDDGTNDRYLAAADRSKPTTAKIELNTKELMAEVHLPYEVLEDNIEGQSFESHVMRLIGERAAQDLEDWALNADESSLDDFYALNDGLLASAVTNEVDNLNGGITPDLFEAAMLAMPQKYLRNLSALRHFITVQDHIRYRGNVARRATGYGDSMLTTDGNIFAFGVRADAAPLMPAQNGLFTFPKNILFGIQRQIQVETDKDIRARTIIIVLTLRCDVKWDEEEAVVKFVNI